MKSNTVRRSFINGSSRMFLIDSKIYNGYIILLFIDL